MTATVLNGLTETHCHILPGIDDGACDVETSLKMIAKLAAQGAKKIVCTPHYYSDSISLDDFLQKRDAAAAKLKAALPPESPEIKLGAEVYISKYLFSNEDLSKIKIEGTDYALIEHSFAEEFSERACNRLIDLICDHGITPILAHIERYKSLIDKPDKLDYLLSLGCVAQVNINSFANESRHIRKKLFKYLESGRITLIGSDCHNMSSRPPEYEPGAKEIIKKCGEHTLNELIQNAAKIF